MHAGKVIVLFVIAALVLLPWLAIRDVRRHPAGRWERAGRSRALWIGIIVLVPILGAALYIRRVRPGLRADALG